MLKNIGQHVKICVLTWAKDIDCCPPSSDMVLAGELGVNAAAYGLSLDTGLPTGVLSGVDAAESSWLAVLLGGTLLSYSGKWRSLWMLILISGVHPICLSATSSIFLCNLRSSRDFLCLARRRFSISSAAQNSLWALSYTNAGSICL